MTRYDVMLQESRTIVYRTEAENEDQAKANVKNGVRTKVFEDQPDSVEVIGITVVDE